MELDCFSCLGDSSVLCDSPDSFSRQRSAMAMALCSFRASPRSVLLGEEFSWSSSSLSTVVLLSSRLSIEPKCLHFQRTFADSRRWRSTERACCRPGTAFANATTTAVSSFVALLSVLLFFAWWTCHSCHDYSRPPPSFWSCRLLGFVFK